MQGFSYQFGTGGASKSTYYPTGIFRQGVLQKLVDEGFQKKVLDRRLAVEIYEKRVKEEMQAIHEKGI